MSGQTQQQVWFTTSTIADNNVHCVTYLQRVVVTTSEFPDDKVCVSELYPCRQKVMIIVNDIMS